MWITADVDLPEEVLDAHERGELVFFVGAGASLDSPSDLPLFTQLVKDLATRAAHPFNPHVGLDVFLGELESLPGGFDVHTHTCQIIANPHSLFNRTHRAIVDLAGMGGNFRVVTTNYDDHLSAAAEDAAVAIPAVWCAPALPLGRDFNGLVHLHGSVVRPGQPIILTDRDFGRAYLGDSWATRFLSQMFDRFTVVFIGYSHDDLIMRYLALGLNSNKGSGHPKRFVFTDDPSNKKWEYLGIQPIGYPVVDGEHTALPDALTAWADRAMMGETDHASRIADVVAGGTVLPLPDRDYLWAQLGTSSGVRHFAAAVGELADERKLDWLIWLEDFPGFKSLFSESKLTEAARALGVFFANIYVESPDLSGAALQTLMRHGQVMSRDLFEDISWRVPSLMAKDLHAGARWQTILATSIHGSSAPCDVSALAPVDIENVSASTSLLWAICRPYLTLKPRWFVDESVAQSVEPIVEATWKADEYTLEACIKVCIARSAPGDRSLGEILENSVLAAYQLLDSYNGEVASSSLGFHRSAIEPHDQNEFREPIDAIIDGLRDYGCKSLVGNPDLPDLWWDTGRDLMRRLAIYLITSDVQRDSDQKLMWLLNRTGLYEESLKHETYQLLAEAVHKASAEVKSRVLSAARDGANYPEGIPNRERHLSYAKYNLLSWLVSTDSQWTEARADFDQLQSRHPDFAPREHPDFDRWVTSGTWGGVLPMETDRFVQQLEESGVSALEEIIGFDYSERAFGQPSWRDALDLVRLGVGQRPDLGLPFWDAVVARTDLKQKQTELLGATCEGWAKADLGEFADDIVKRLYSRVPDSGLATPVGRFLVGQIERQIDESDSPALSGMRALAIELWDIHGAKFTRPPSSPALGIAPLYLNSWPGSLAQYWGREIDRRWRGARDDWCGMSAEESNALARLLSDNDAALDATQPAIAGDLFFYFSADEEFSVKYLIPLFGDGERHEFAWSTFLHHPRWNDRLLRAGLLDCIIEEFDRLGQVEDGRLHRVFFGLVASVATSANLSAGERRCLLDKTVSSSAGVHALGFAEAVGIFVSADGIDASRVWDVWLGDHVDRRLNGEPRAASSAELEAWADIVPFLGEKIPVALTKFDGHNIGLSRGLRAPKWPEEAVLEGGTAIVKFYAERIRCTDEVDFTMKHRVQAVIGVVGQQGGANAAAPIFEAGVKKGLLVQPGSVDES